LFHAGFMLGLIFGPENAGGMFIWNVGWLSTEYYMLKMETSITMYWTPWRKRKETSAHSLHSRVSVNIVTCVSVTIDEVLDWLSDLLASLIQSVVTFYSSLSHRVVPTVTSSQAVAR
jgi:hypothetical protein